MYPIRIASLEEAEHKHLFVMNFANAQNLHFPGGSGHAGTPHRAGQPAGFLVRLPENAPGVFQCNAKVVLRSGIPNHKHVIGNHPQIYLFPPHLRPDGSVRVNVVENGGLSADFGPRGTNAPNGFLNRRGFQFHRMGKMRH